MLFRAQRAMKAHFKKLAARRGRKCAIIAVAHSRDNGTVPVRLVHADEHALDHVLGLFIEGLGFSDVPAACLQIGEDGEIPRQVVTITYALAGLQTLGSTRFGCRQVSTVAIESCQFKHRICLYPVELNAGCELACVLQVGDGLAGVSGLLGDGGEDNQYGGFVASLVL